MYVDVCLCAGAYQDTRLDSRRQLLHMLHQQPTAEHQRATSLQKRPSRRVAENVAETAAVLQGLALCCGYCRRVVAVLQWAVLQ